MSDKKGFEGLIEVMARLRGEGGCPWDKEQSHQSLKPYLIEEAYETLEAIESGVPHKMREELGDLLFQVVFHSRIAEEENNFTMDDVVETIRTKMIRRHPHVFGDGSASSSGEVLEQWEEIKRKEKGHEDRKSALDGIPKNIPSLLRAHRIQDKAARVGFDWDHIDQVFEKVEEEMGEFREAFARRDAEEMENELGDLFFALVNIARFIEVNPEDALRKTISRFIKRFHHIEESIAGEGKKMSQYSLEELDKYWEEAKTREKSL